MNKLSRMILVMTAMICASTEAATLKGIKGDRVALIVTTVEIQGIATGESYLLTNGGDKKPTIRITVTKIRKNMVYGSIVENIADATIGADYFISSSPPTEMDGMDGELPETYNQKVKKETKVSRANLPKNASFMDNSIEVTGLFGVHKFDAEFDVNVFGARGVYQFAKFPLALGLHGKAYKASIEQDAVAQDLLSYVFGPTVKIDFTLQKVRPFVLYDYSILGISSVVTTFAGADSVTFSGTSKSQSLSIGTDIIFGSFVLGGEYVLSASQQFDLEATVDGQDQTSKSRVKDTGFNFFVGLAF